MSEDSGKIGSGKRGRPSYQESQDIDKILHDCFIQDLSAVYVIQKTGISKGTVYAKFKEYSELLKENERIDFVEQHEINKSRYILALDDLILRNNGVLAMLESEMQEYRRKKKEIPDKIMRQFFEMSKSIMSLLKEKSTQSLKIPLDKELKSRITEEVESHGS